MAFQNRVEGDISIYNDLIDLSANCHCPHRVLPVFKSLEGRGIRPDFARSKTLVFLLRYLCTHTHTHIHTHTHTHTHTGTYAHTHTRTRTHTLTHSLTLFLCLSLARLLLLARDLRQKRPTTVSKETYYLLLLARWHRGFGAFEFDRNTHRNTRTSTVDILQLLTYFNC
jgi:hypothetical protein